MGKTFVISDGLQRIILGPLLFVLYINDFVAQLSAYNFKVARYSFSGPIPPKFEHKLRRHKQSFGKIATTVVLDKDENLL